jgi:hypothetical protein
VSLPQPRVPGYSRLGMFLIRARIVIAVCSWIYRWFAGRPILGRADWRPTNATFFRRGHYRFPGHEADRLTFWAYLPEAVRSLIRQVLLLVVVCSYWIYWWIVEHPVTTTLIWILLGVTGVWRIRVWWRHRRFRAVYVTPLAEEAARVLGIPPYTRTSSWLTVSPTIPGLTYRLVKDMSPREARVRRWYGEHIEHVVRFTPDRVMRVWWWLSGRYAPLQKLWKDGK